MAVGCSGCWPLPTRTTDRGVGGGRPWLPPGLTMLSLWMLDDARTLDAQTAPHGSSDPSSTDAFRRERDVLVNAQDPRSVNPTSRRSVGSSRLSRKSRKREHSRPWILDLGPWNGHGLPKMVCRAHVCAVTSLSSPKSFARSSR